MHYRGSLSARWGWARACLLAVAALAATGTAQAQAPARAILLDGAGPWQDANWALGVTEFRSLLADAGYQVSIVSPADLPAATLTPDMLLAVPNLQNLPLACFQAITSFMAAGGSGPLKYANGEFAGIRVQCPGLDVAPAST